jgi:hypothetical protein
VSWQDWPSNCRKDIRISCETHDEVSPDLIETLPSFDAMIVKALTRCLQ